MEEIVKYKQVIVMRKFKNLRTGKYIAQGCHASTIAMKLAQSNWKKYYKEYWEGRIIKIVVYVETEQELRDLYHKALNSDLPCSLVTDAGLTEFNGVPTLTAVGIGPAPEDLIDPITKHLPLF